jgi:hypothetical protein
LTVPPPPTSPERRLPLRQLPSERSFSASPQNADSVRNDRVFPHLNSLQALRPAENTFYRETIFVTLTVTFSVFLRQFPAI